MAILRRLFSGEPSVAERIEAELRNWGSQIWPERFVRGHDHGEEVAESLRRLRLTLDADQLRGGAADLVLQPEPWIVKYNAHDPIKHVIVHTALQVLATDPPPDLAIRIRDRLQFVRDHPDTVVRLPHHLPEYPPIQLPIEDLPPTLEQLVTLLEQATPDHPTAIELITDLALHDYTRMSRSDRFVARYVLFLHRAGVLSFELFEQIAYANPARGSLLAPSRPARWLGADDWPVEHADALTAKLIALPAWSDAEARLLVGAEPAPGHLIDAVRLHAAHGLGAFDTGRDYRQTPHQAAVAVLAGTGHGDASDEVDRLRRYPADTLQALLPVAPISVSVLTAALGWEPADDLIALLHAGREIEASADPRVGAIDAAAVRDAIAAAGPELTTRIWRTFKHAKFRPNLIKLLQAATGEHADWIRSSLPKRNQLAVRAMAAAPLEEGFDEVRSRYQWIQRYRAEAGQFGSQRQSSERGAADAALHNLATNSGYRDVTRLEVAVAAHDPAPIPSWRIGDYDVTIALTGGHASTVFRSGAKTLKTAPQAVRQSDRYDEIKAARKSVQAELTRFSRMLERTMTLDEQFSNDDLSSLLGIPVAAAALAGLVVVDSTGVSACYRAGGFVDADAAPVQLDGGVTVAHPIGLAARGQLVRWQERLVADRIVQPFQQAFRSHYPLTPVELENGFVSARFADRIIDTGRATALFTNREWVLPQEEGGAVSKGFPSLGLTAVWELTDVGHHLTETTSVGTSGISFITGTNWYRDDRVALDQVPATVFSEVMRDADLVVSVAPGDPVGQGRFRGTVERFSPETLDSRRGLIAALVGDLQIPGVDFDDTYALVTGQLASYRVHLGTGDIFIGHGRHLCVVPTGWGARKTVFLPFIDDADSRISLVISKIMLLSADAKIKDTSILEQIRLAGPN